MVYLSRYRYGVWWKFKYFVKCLPLYLFRCVEPAISTIGEFVVRYELNNAERVTFQRIRFTTLVYSTELYVLLKSLYSSNYEHVLGNK